MTSANTVRLGGLTAICQSLPILSHFPSLSRLALRQFCPPQQGTQRNSGTGANFAAFAKFVACTRITPRTNPRNSATGANLPIFIWAGEVYLMEDCPRIALPRLPRSSKPAQCQAAYALEATKPAVL